MAEASVRSALARFAASEGLAVWQGDGISIRELPFAAIVRVQALDDACAAAAGTALGMALPEPGQLVSGGGRSVAWVALREWLVFLPAEDEAVLLASLASAGAGVFAVSIGDARTGIAVAGSRATEVLARGTGLDLHASVFPLGRVCNTRLAQLAVMLARPSGDAGFHVWVDRSAGAWLWQWLLDAASEFVPAGQHH
jgi:sarcosine oxidase subunit gamma